MKTKLKWRLSKLPTPSELVELVNNKLVTQEEAKEILFDSVTKEDTDAEALKAEIKFLRQVIEDLSKSRSNTVTVIEKHIDHYKQWDWYRPYYTYCSTGLNNVTSGLTLDGGNGGGTTKAVYTATSLNDLKTF